jgi:FMN phosphatase YigB (HAD superfamily)
MPVSEPASALLALDFDGTMTDAEAEGVPFTDGYLEDIALLVGEPLDAVLAIAAEARRVVAAAPDAHGWMFGGRIVAPASVDPYLRMMPVARAVLDHFGAFREPADRTRLLDDILYKYNYPKTRTVFREAARATLDALAAMSGIRTYVVTNSHTAAVQKKVVELARAGGDEHALDWLVERVRGNAKKYVIDDDFTAVPERLDVPGLARPVLLRRRRYHDALAGLLADAGLGFADLLVVGDIFELDLALPLALGARVVLVANAHTPTYEVDYVTAHPRGAVVPSLAHVPELLQRGGRT